MHKVPREELLSRIAVALAVMPAHVKKGLSSKLPHEADAARAEAAMRICNIVDGASVAVIEAEPIAAPPYGLRPGKWGEDEPDPFATPGN